MVCNVSSGNAFWCKIVANFIIENGIEKAKDENYLSNSLQFLMFCRLDKFSSVEQLVAKTASIIGFQFSLSVLSKIVKSPLLISCLEALQDHGFIFSNGFDGIDYIFQFQNEKIRSMLYEITPKRYLITLFLSSHFVIFYIYEFCYQFMCPFISFLIFLFMLILLLLLFKFSILIDVHLLSIICNTLLHLFL